jgi:ubiquinone/menaquinone biosynthesis C-methylase UbiE
MMKEYDDIAAGHYAAYRPPLHEIILNKCLKHERFKRGLDIGCGTGQSSIALSKYGKKIIGIDPSHEMIQKAIPHTNVAYEHYDGSRLFFPDNHFDIITFAGSLFYGKSQNLLDQAIRVCSNPGVILVYDFQLFLEDLFVELTINLQPEISKYNHAADFSGLRTNQLKEVLWRTELLDFHVNSSNLAHVILSLPGIYNTLVGNKPFEDPYPYLKGRLDLLSNNKSHVIKAKVYYRKYRCSKFG